MSKAWKPKKGKRFYWIDGEGRIKEATWSGGDWFYKDLLKMGNVFKTRQEAVVHADEMKERTTR